MDRYDEESNRILVLKTTSEIPFLTPIATPIAPILTLLDSLLGEVVGFCEHCADPIFEADDIGCYSHYREAGIYYHGRCEYATGSLAPKGFWSTNDLAWQLREAGIDPRKICNKAELPPQTVENTQQIDPSQCYLCGTDDPEDEISRVELPHQVVDVCGRCSVSYQHQEMVRQEYGLAESEV